MTAAVAVLQEARARSRRRVVLVGSVLAVATLLAFLATVSLGEYPIPPGDLLSSLVGAGPARVEFVVTRLRLPRALAGLAVGASLGLAGALFQRLLRNPLASPDIIGVGAGASAAAVVALTMLGLSGLAVSGAAVLGAAATATLIVVLARRGRGSTGLHGVRFVLIGVGVGSALLAIVSWLMTTASLTTAQQTLLWLTGSLNNVSWASTTPLLVSVAVLVPLALVAAGALPRLELGDEAAAALGLAVERSRLLLLAVAVLLVAAAVAVAGPVSFVALVSGPVAARLAGPGRASLPHAALIGALLVLLADLVARHLLGDVPLPVGVVTGVIGAPYLLLLLARSRAGGTA
ncbi:iron chelate uptake ABC transporter family permease subunit [Actinomycetospora sp. OC33-EN08]|uniref:Iron chelate uptake ABC transporter family permease subunit n=1 Tax=Actinomycetospora aurantiaca TaxID=3129233 RepID=A0ABU8MLE3_9PSEU